MISRKREKVCFVQSYRIIDLKAAFRIAGAINCQKKAAALDVTDLHRQSEGYRSAQMRTEYFFALDLAQMGINSLKLSGKYMAHFL
jgi:hypothetical protein